MQPGPGRSGQFKGFAGAFPSLVCGTAQARGPSWLCIKCARADKRLRLPTSFMPRKTALIQVDQRCLEPNALLFGGFERHEHKTIAILTYSNCSGATGQTHHFLQ